MDECEEPRCTHKVTTSWGGKKVCQDHYEQYKEDYDRIILSLRDLE